MSDSLTERPERLRVAMVGPPTDAGGIGRYGAQLCDRLRGGPGLEVEYRRLSGGLVARVRTALAVRHADVVHLQFEYGLFRPRLLYAWLVLPVLLCGTRLRRTPVVVTVHEVWTGAAFGPVAFAYVRAVHWLLAVAASELVFMTPETRADFRPLPGTPTRVIPHGVDVEAVRPVERPDARRSFGLDPDDVVVSQIGYVSPRKGTETFLELASDHPDHEFLLAGGPLRAEDRPYFEKVREAAPPNVTVTGVLSNERFHRAFVATDVAVLAYRDIRQSGILNWCFAYGVPAVCSSVERFETLWSEGAPLVLFGGGSDRSSAAEALSEALSRRGQLSTEMQEYGKTRDLRSVAEAYGKRYRQLVNR